MREFGICMFLACVGLKAGETFVDSVMNGGLVWVGLGVIITVLPLMIVGPLAYKVFKVDYFTLMGVMSGSMTDPPALAYSSTAVGNDRPSIGYSTVYPLTMFLRIVTAQLIVLLLCGAV
jgi:putative transport protein